MPPALMQSQFDALEPLGPDERGITIDLDEVADAQDVVAAFQARSAAINRTDAD